MQLAKPVGRGAASLKYDILSAMAVHALAQEGSRQRRILRLIALITARYNWQRNELSIGQAEIARLWSVDPRTVKREMAAFRSAGWITTKRQGARGRVSVHGVEIGKILADTAGHWPSIGSDFVERMSDVGPQETPKSNVVQLRPSAGQGGPVWSAARAILAERCKAEYAAWIAPLGEAGREGGRLFLDAPSKFHASYVQTHLAGRILEAVRQADGTVTSVTIG